MVKRTKLEILFEKISECIDRFEKLDKSKLSLKNLQDLNWDSTNLSGNIQTELNKKLEKQ